MFSSRVYYNLHICWTYVQYVSYSRSFKNSAVSRDPSLYRLVTHITTIYSSVTSTVYKHVQEKTADYRRKPKYIKYTNTYEHNILHSANRFAEQQRRWNEVVVGKHVQFFISRLSGGARVLSPRTNRIPPVAAARIDSHAGTPHTHAPHIIYLLNPNNILYDTNDGWHSVFPSSGSHRARLVHLLPAAKSWQ